MTPAEYVESILIGPGREVPALATVVPRVRHAPFAIRSDTNAVPELPQGFAVDTKREDWE